MLDARAARYLEEHADRDGDDPLAVIRGLLDTVVGRHRGVGIAELSTVLAAEATAPAHPAHEHFRERYSSTRRFLARQFAALQEEGRMRTKLAPGQMAATISVLRVEVRLPVAHQALGTHGHFRAALR